MVRHRRINDIVIIKIKVIVILILNLKVKVIGKVRVIMICWVEVVVVAKL